MRVGVVGVGNMGRQYADAIRTIDGLELPALCTRTLDKIQDLPEPKFADHRTMIASGRVDAVVIATPHWSHPDVAIDALRAGASRPDRQAPRRPRGGRPAHARRAPGQAPPLRRDLQRADASGEREDPVHDRGRRARGAPPRDLARHGHLPLARLLRERRVARDLGGRGRGRHHQPGLPRPRSPAVVRGAPRAGHREDRSRQVPSHRGRGRRQRAARVSRAARPGSSP